MIPCGAVKPVHPRCLPKDQIEVTVIDQTVGFYFASFFGNFRTTKVTFLSRFITIYSNDNYDKLTNLSVCSYKINV